MAMLRNFLLLFVIISMGNAGDDFSHICPSGWTHFGNRCYKYFSHLTNWITAEKRCLSLGANLASVHNAMENNFLLSLLPPSARSWIGGHDGVQDGYWLWTDGTAFLYSNWCSGEPNNSQRPENCLEIKFPFDHCWNDVPCSHSMNYICAKKFGH